MIKVKEFVVQNHANVGTIEKEKVIEEGIAFLKKDWWQNGYAYLATQWVREVAPVKWDTLVAEFLG